MSQRGKREKVTSCNGKRRFRDVDEAIKALHYIQLKPSRNRENGTKPCRAYACDVCKGAHLTSQRRWAGVHPDFLAKKVVAHEVYQQRKQKTDIAFEKARAMRQEMINSLSQN